jgi:hypothetical protein
MSDADAGAKTVASFRSFVERLDADPHGALLLANLERGHTPDENGWCRHVLHTLTNHPECHPCSTAQLVAAIRETTPWRPLE